MTSKWRWLAVALVAPMLVLAACGDDDDDDEGAGGDGATTTSAQAAAPEPFCADVVKVQTIEPEFPEGEEEPSEEESERIGTEFFNEEFMPLLKKVQAEAPPSAKPAVDRITTYIEGQGPELFFADAPNEEFQAIENDANAAAASACRAEQNQVTAVDYAFQGTRPSLKAGYQHFTFTNNGAELHEQVLLKKKATTTQSFDEIIALGSEDQEAAEALVDDTFANFAFPGGNDSVVLDLEAGEYAMVCFIPVGLTPEAAQSGEEPAGEPPPPHVARGMKTEFTVA